MKRYNDLKHCANIFKVLGLLSVVINLLASAVAQDLTFAVVGLISLLWLYAWGAALLTLGDIAYAVRASASLALEQDEARKARASKNGKSLNLKHVKREKSA
ncbi:hypothetical protein LCGC14_1297220 [marine sediment metagenome]|uniref:Uncharacterized protein n=1 Tax=marine sediment metagenome TaxID=412755 RepID=A0A0F9LBC1_9ZZZZ